MKGLSGMRNGDGEISFAPAGRDCSVQQRGRLVLCVSQLVGRFLSAGWGWCFRERLGELRAGCRRDARCTMREAGRFPGKREARDVCACVHVCLVCVQYSAVQCSQCRRESERKGVSATRRESRLAKGRGAVRCALSQVEVKCHWLRISDGWSREPQTANLSGLSRLCKQNHRLRDGIHSTPVNWPSAVPPCAWFSLSGVHRRKLSREGVEP